MNDAYDECLVKQQPPSYAPVLKGIMILLCVLSLVFAILLPVGIVGLLISGFLTYLVFQNMDLEYEYLYINGQLTIDKIMGKSKRKNVWDGDLEQVSTVTLVNPLQAANQRPDRMKVYDCSSKRDGAKIYSLVAQAGQGSIKIIFEPSEEMIRHMRKKYPSKVQI